jgi:hypothetical protein
MLTINVLLKIVLVMSAKVLSAMLRREALIKNKIKHKRTRVDCHSIAFKGIKPELCVSKSRANIKELKRS